MSKALVIIILAVIGACFLLWWVVLPIMLATIKGWAYMAFRCCQMRKGWYKHLKCWKALPAWLWCAYWEGFFLDGSVTSVECGDYCFKPPFFIRKGRHRQ